MWLETRSLQPVWRWERRYPEDAPVFREHVVVAELTLKGLRTRGDLARRRVGQLAYAHG